jgi:hypothetical protein
LLKFGAIAQLDVSGDSSAWAESKEPPNSPTTRIYSAGEGGSQIFPPLSLARLWANKRRCRASTQLIRIEEIFHTYDDETGQIGNL